MPYKKSGHLSTEQQLMQQQCTLSPVAHPQSTSAGIMSFLTHSFTNKVSVEANYNVFFNDLGTNAHRIQVTTSSSFHIGQ